MKGYIFSQRVKGGVKGFGSYLKYSTFKVFIWKILPHSSLKYGEMIYVSNTSEKESESQRQGRKMQFPYIC